MNSLCFRQENRAAKLHEKKDHSTAENAMDAKTSLLLMKMVNNGVLDSIGKVFFRGGGGGGGGGVGGGERGGNESY